MAAALWLLITFTSALRPSPLKPLIIFGRPGAGKTTIADALLKHADAEDAQGVDLDVCVPQWMRDNFARGIYPSLDERRTFAAAAADHLDAVATSTGRCVVSFSFVNDDLRDYFRDRFPEADWVLVDTSENDAAERIARREGHFYTGPTAAEPDRGSEWAFAPVAFDHVRLDGRRPVEDNVRALAPFLTSH